MFCPFCNYESTKVLESRSTAEKSSIRRRRECENCQGRFTTYEKIELMPLFVIKNSGFREEYCREKLFNSIIKACSKCGVSVNIIEKIVNNIESEITASGKKEINSYYLGERILESLKKINEVAYIRYLSIFKHFKTIDDFILELRTLDKDKDKQISLV